MLTPLHAATPAFTITLGSALTLLGAVLAVLDSVWRFRRPGGNAFLAVLALVLGLLLLVRVFTPLHPYVSTTFPALYLLIGTTLVLLVELLVKGARKSGLLPLTIVATLVCGAAAVIAYLRIA